MLRLDHCNPGSKTVFHPLRCIHPEIEINFIFKRLMKTTSYSAISKKFSFQIYKTTASTFLKSTEPPQYPAHDRFGGIRVFNTNQLIRHFQNILRNKILHSHSQQLKCFLELLLHKLLKVKLPF